MQNSNSDATIRSTGAMLQYKVAMLQFEVQSTVAMLQFKIAMPEI